MMDLSFYKNKKILITGHTGFKGSWMCKALLLAGAEITGYALMPPTEPSLFAVMGLFGEEKEGNSNKKTENGNSLSAVNHPVSGAIVKEEERKGGSSESESNEESCEYFVQMDQGTLRTVIGDVCDLSGLKKVFEQAQPEIVIHMAAQPIVRESYRNPVGTYETNVMGTVNVLECIRLYDCVKSFVNVTTDKVYLNREWDWGYRENEELNGYDPYSNSKSCSELVTSSYRNSFFGGEAGRRANGNPIAITTMRAGNVIGGGDFAADRIIPDCIRSVEKQEEITVRNPYSTRPYQHVLEPVMAYLMVAARQYEDTSLAGCYNVGPDDADCYTTGNIVDLFCECWNRSSGSSAYKAGWRNVAEEGAPHEANFLKLDCAKLKKTFGWKPVWNLETAMEKIVEWSVIFLDAPEDVTNQILLCMQRQIEQYSSATQSPTFLRE